MSYSYDGAGRLQTFAGTLGDGLSRTYSSDYEYNEWGSMQQEKFGTSTPLYHKQRFNVRGQMWDLRLSTVSYTTDPANGDRGAIVNYFSTSYTQGGSGTDNNGHVVRQENYIPGGFYQQTYAYDDLNRLKSVTEKLNGTGDASFKQEYAYDPFGNRTVDQNVTTPNVPRPSYTVDPNTNRLIAPSGYTYAYDAAGNQTTDNYTGTGDRTFDAENRMVGSAGVSPSTYKYSGGGQRVRRILNGVETWQVYGIGGELLAEYAANASPTSPQKEYGYRGGQLLITIESAVLSAPPPSTLTAANGSTNVALGWSAASGAVNYRVERKGAGTGYVLAGTTATSTFTDTGATLGSAYLYRVCAANAAGNCTSVFSNVALGAPIPFTDPTIISIADDPTGASVTTAKFEHVTELRSAVNAVRTLADLSPATWTNQNLTRYVSLINADDIRDLRTKLDEALTALGIATSAYEDSTLQGAPNGTFVRKVHIMQLRQRVTSGNGGSGGGFSAVNLRWLVMDHLGTPRITADESGSLGGIKRHDYLPFGEEIESIGGRDATHGYITDNTRQKFTGYEADTENELNFAQARYQSSKQGRFISVDPLGSSATMVNPQGFNRYSYVQNNPINSTDPTGMALSDMGVYQTTDPSLAGTLQGATDAAFRMQINTQYAVRNGFSITGVSNGSRIQFSLVTAPATAVAPQAPPQKPTTEEPVDDVIKTEVKASGGTDSQSFWHKRYAAQLQADMVGTTIIWNKDVSKDDALISEIHFAQDYERTVAGLKSKGYLTGPENFAFNPYHHSGGQEFRDPDSRWGKLSFHFMIPYPDHNVTWLGPLLPPLVHIDRRSARGIHAHVDKDNPKTQLIPHTGEFLGSVWDDIQKRFGFK